MMIARTIPRVPSFPVDNLTVLFQVATDPNNGGSITIGALTLIGALVLIVPAVVGMIVGLLRYIAKENDKNRQATEAAHTKRVDEIRADFQAQIISIRADFQKQIADLQAGQHRSDAREDQRNIVNAEMLDTFKDAVQIMRLQTELAEKTAPVKRRTAANT